MTKHWRNLAFSVGWHSWCVGATYYPPAHLYGMWSWSLYLGPLTMRVERRFARRARERWEAGE